MKKLLPIGIAALSGLLPALIIGIMVAGVAIFAFGNHMPTATSPAPDTATGQSSRAPGSTPEGPPPVNR